jgi:hypothetical protein
MSYPVTPTKYTPNQEIVSPPEVRPARKMAFSRSLFQGAPQNPTPSLAGRADLTLPAPGPRLPASVANVFPSPAPKVERLSTAHSPLFLPVPESMPSPMQPRMPPPPPSKQKRKETKCPDTPCKITRHKQQKMDTDPFIQKIKAVNEELTNKGIAILGQGASKTVYRLDEHTVLKHYTYPFTDKSFPALAHKLASCRQIELERFEAIREFFDISRPLSHEQACALFEKLDLDLSLLADVCFVQEYIPSEMTLNEEAILDDLEILIREGTAKGIPIDYGVDNFGCREGSSHLTYRDADAWLPNEGIEGETGETPEERRNFAISFMLDPLLQWNNFYPGLVSKLAARFQDSDPEIHSRILVKLEGEKPIELDFDKLFPGMVKA